MRPSGRAPDEMRAITIETGFTKHAEGSCLISRERRGTPAAMAARQGFGLGYGRIFDASPRHAYTRKSRSSARKAIGTNAGNSTAYRA